MASRIRISNWNAAALAGGVALGVLGSRLLPPVVAQASGTARAKFGRDPFRKLEDDHRLIEATLLDMAAGAEEKARELYDEHAQMKIHLWALESALTSPSQWRDRVRRLSDVILPHIRDEEDTEFPRLRRMMQEKEHASLAGKILREEAMVL